MTTPLTYGHRHQRPRLKPDHRPNWQFPVHSSRVVVGQVAEGPERRAPRSLRAVRKENFTEIEKSGRKKYGARAGARHVSWESCQLAAHTRLGRSVGRSDRRKLVFFKMM